MMQNALSQTVLNEWHKANGAKMTPFAGYDMPVWFEGLRQEHQAVRERAGAFDVAHMGLLSLRGEGAMTLIQNLVCNDMRRAVDKMVYGMILNEEGKILDDVMAGQHGAHVLLVVNASNKIKIQKWIDRHNPDKVQVEDLNKNHVFVAVQGPSAADKLHAALKLNLSDVPRFGMTTQSIQGRDILMTRTGYTGEDGFELIIPNDIAVETWTQIIDAGVAPCGLGARDSLRLEYGLPLYGQDLNEDISPLNTRYTWAVKWDTPFIGKAALEREKAAGVTLKAVGLEMTDRVIPRTGYPIVEGGRITSGTLSPSLNKPIALALLTAEKATIGESVHVEIRGTQEKATVVEVPFK